MSYETTRVPPMQISSWLATSRWKLCALGHNIRSHRTRRYSGISKYYWDPRVLNKARTDARDKTRDTGASLYVVAFQVERSEERRVGREWSVVWCQED